ncbi:P-loop containing nucleoside triphosphate hydrolase protein [Melanogaster broomeanus]|nr:P-loop containing nucleoside triphosphate hydrolase protein [Melanogaster broomeanus]
MAQRKQEQPATPCVFDPDDVSRIKHTKIGIWDLYQESQSDMYIPGASHLETVSRMIQDLPYVWRMVKDICKIPRCLMLMSLYFLVGVAASLIPAISLWHSGQLLHLVETAIEKRTVDKNVLLQNRISLPLNLEIKQFYSSYVFHAMARLDVPTFEDPAVKRQLESAWSISWGHSVAWQTVQVTSNVIMTMDLFWLQFSIFQSLLQWAGTTRSMFDSSVWAATTKNEDYIRIQGFKKLIDGSSHRKEVVAGNLGEHATKIYREAASRLGKDAGDYHEMRRAYMIKDSLTVMSILRGSMGELPQIVFKLRAVQYPVSIPLSLASLTLINNTASSFTSNLFGLFGESFSLAGQFASVRELYQIPNISNRVVDGKVPFPENQQTVLHGISIEFRNVSFRYPGTKKDALHNISFKIGAGQLCVIVGVNGSGKSTILKLISRIYDATEGTILIDDQDIKSLKLADLRRAMSILFQDYTHFPLSIKENISLGNPDLAEDEDKIREAARLGGAEDFIDKLPEGFDTYIERPVQDYYSNLPEGTTTLFGRQVGYSGIRGIGSMRTTDSLTLSGGQMQRLAVSRTFMRSLVSETESPVGLILFDEPSAALDPKAEHDLFERLRALRGNKTMIFSSHRFGNLTRHADLILYMDDAEIKEAGTQEELLKLDGEYARIWGLQAQAFV